MPQEITLSADREIIRRQHRHQEYRSRPRHPIVILTDNLDKETNLGGIIRTAEAFLAEAVLVNRSAAEVGFKGAKGAEYWQPVEWGVDVREKIQAYQARGYTIVALEQSEQAVPLPRFTFPQHVVLVVGAELFGVSPDVLALADAIVYIPQAGLVKSLNVHVATAIALYEYSRQHWMLNHFEPDRRHLVSSNERVRIKRRRTPATVNSEQCEAS
jgi:tRNA G18 (ribose-2'-O)-methylase SpoU